MKNKVYATKSLDDNGDVFNIQFDVVFEDEIGERTNIGFYCVGLDNSILGGLDPYITENHKDFIQQAKNIMLENGLSEIAGNISPQNYFYKHTITMGVGSSGAFDRAQKYIENNNINCISENGFIDFSLDRYNDIEESHKSL